MVGLVGLEPTTLRLSGVRSNHLSYRPILTFSDGDRKEVGCNELTCVPVFGRTEVRPGLFLKKGGDPAAGSPTATLLRLSPNHRTRLRRRPPYG